MCCAVEYKLRAERRLGEILKGTEKATGAKGIGKARSAVPDEYRTQPPTYFDLGLTKKVSSRAQQLAGIPPVLPMTAAEW